MPETAHNPDLNQADAPDRQGPVAPREAAVLEELAREAEATVAFQGLRRRLDLHQQALARTLQRLEEAGLVAHESEGYRLTERGLEILHRLPTARDPGPAVTVIQAKLPPGLRNEAVAGHLARRWFRGLRWWGRADGPGQTTLTWLTDPGQRPVRLHLTPAEVSIDLAAPATREQYAGARALLLALAGLYGLPPAEDSDVIEFTGYGRSAS